MAKQVESLFLNLGPDLGPDLGPKLEPTPEDDSALSPHHTTGILPSQALRGLVGEGVIASAEALAPGQIQPASLDLRLGGVAYRVRASYLPGSSHTVRQKIEAIGMHEVDLSGGAVLERGAVFIVPLQEELRLKKGLSGVANPKSSTGRLDIFTRLITDYATQFDRVTATRRSRSSAGIDRGDDFIDRSHTHLVLLPEFSIKIEVMPIADEMGFFSDDV